MNYKVHVSEQRGKDIFGAIAFGIVAVPSSLGIFAFLICVVAEMKLRLFRQFSWGFDSGLLQSWADTLRFFGLIAHPAAIILAAIASILPIGKRMKLYSWLVVAAGIMSWLIAGWLVGRRP